MARTKQSEGEQPQQEPKGKKFSSASGSFTSIEPGEEHRGHFINAGEQEIMDRRTRQPKKIMVIKIRSAENPDEIKRFACATMLERCWEDLVDEYGNGDHDTACKQLRGRLMVITRGQSTTTRDGNELGQYEIFVAE